MYVGLEMNSVVPSDAQNERTIPEFIADLIAPGSPLKEVVKERASLTRVLSHPQIRGRFEVRLAGLFELALPATIE